MKNDIDPDGYFDRIGYTGARRPTVEVLHALTAAHAQSIPFENIDVLLRRPIRLEPAALYRKLVLDRRGGYCFEQNGLLLEVLRQLGFDVRPLGARVRLAAPDRGVIPGRTHMLLEVRVEGTRWLTDVGVGAATLTRALRFEADREQSTPHDVRRLQHVGERWFHQVRHGGEWIDVYEFTEGDLPLADRKIASWYTSTCPDSHFHSELTVALALPGGRRATLKDGVFTLRAADGTATGHQLRDHAELLQVLREEFGIALAAGTRLDVAGIPVAA
ncbi:MAG TPA: arylamine N-acetyltransferase [Rhodanobacteraceae bacterium]|nr:arylamine N-acetyltransferase [Rhodanobacteraceae bacterium]